MGSSYTYTLMHVMCPYAVPRDLRSVLVCSFKKLQPSNEIMILTFISAIMNQALFMRRASLLAF